MTPDLDRYLLGRRWIWLPYRRPSDGYNGPDRRGRAPGLRQLVTERIGMPSFAEREHLRELFPGLNPAPPKDPSSFCPSCITRDRHILGLKAEARSLMALIRTKDETINEIMLMLRAARDTHV